VSLERVMSRRDLMGAAAAVLGGGVFVGLTGVVLSSTSAQGQPLSATVRGLAQTPQGRRPRAFLALATYPDSMAGEHGSGGGAHPDWVSYGPATDLRVPTHALVTMTIKQYDSGARITNPYFAKVRGTVDGTMTVNGKTVSSVNSNLIGHTFTLHAAPTNQDPLFVSVPLPAVPDDRPVVSGSAYPRPNIVRFSFLTAGPGSYVWNCEFPCGDGYYAKFGGPMSTRGYMSGTLTVE
jgi:hypothetical protein